MLSNQETRIWVWTALSAVLVGYLDTVIVGTIWIVGFVCILYSRPSAPNLSIVRIGGERCLLVR